MRFVFVDRIVAVEIGRSIETLKNIAASEDVFNDHFPGHPVFPGALIVETVDQATQLLVGMTYDFGRVARLEHLDRTTFRQLVRPGDQLRIRCERTDADEAAWTVQAVVSVGDRGAATARLRYAIDDVVLGSETGARAERVRDLAATLRSDIVARAARLI